MHIRFVPVALALQLAVVCGPALAQPKAAVLTPPLLQLPVSRTVDSRLFVSRRADSANAKIAPKIFQVPQAADSHRARNAIIGGVIGSVVGIGVCTGISSLMNDSANGGFSTCTTKGNLAFGAGGFVAGALVGAAVR